MMRKKCNVCGEVGKMSKEHVPPKRAFNDQKARIYDAIEVIKKENFPWDSSGIKYSRECQGGAYFQTLCVKCNNDTGAWYGSSFVEFLVQSAKLYRSLQINKQLVNGKKLKVMFYQIYPLRIIKQILVMFLAINSPNFCDVHPELREFVLNKDKKDGLDNFGLNIYFMIGEVLRYFGVAAVHQVSKGTRLISELSFPPLGSVLEIKPSVNESGDIRFFGTHFSYDRSTNLPLEVEVLESNSNLPLDYRSKREMIECYIRNKVESMRPEQDR